MARVKKEKHFFTHEEIEFIIDNYQNIELEALTVMFNNYFNLDLNKSQIKNKIGSIGVRKRNVSENYGKYTDEMCIWLVSRYYPGCSILIYAMNLILYLILILQDPVYGISLIDY